MTPELTDGGATVGLMIEQPHPHGVRLLPWRIPVWLIDAALISIMIVGFIVRPLVEDAAHEPDNWTALAVAIALLLTRRRFPVATLTAAVVASAVVIAVIDRPTVLLPVALVALFTVASQLPRRPAIIAGAITTASFVLMITALLRRDAVAGASLAAIAWPAFATAAGAAVRSTRMNKAAAEERAIRAEESRELEAQRRVIEERLRIARDVHDLVAHHIAVVNVQSGVADHLLESDPAAASQALAVVRDAASTVIDELGELLGVLRSVDDTADPTTPTPGLAAIDDLISSFASSGLSVQDERSGVARPLSESAELAAYRVVQEALTNAHKYGDGTASVALRFDDDGLKIVVANPTDQLTTLTDSTGYGLVGMRERIEAVGGGIEFGRPGDGAEFRITATIPKKSAT